MDDGTGNLEQFLAAVIQLVGTENVQTEQMIVADYGKHSLPMPDRIPGAVVLPGSTEEVQEIVRLANEYRVPLFPISAGWNLGLGRRAPLRSGQVVLDLGRRMDRIIEIDEELGYCVVQPGVTFAQMHEELERRGSTLAISPTSGPPLGSLLGNALDKGGGAGLNGSHFENLCGMEVVLGNGEIIRTGEGGLDTEVHPNWHVTKFSFGPALDGIFSQSNYGVVTLAGMWLGRRPPHARSLFFAFDDDADFAEIVDISRRLKNANAIPSMVRVTNDLYLLASQSLSPKYRPGSGRKSLTLEEREELRAKYGLGAWNVATVLHGQNDAALQPSIEAIKSHFLKSGKGRYISQEEAESIAPLSTALDINQLRPAGQELNMLEWRTGGAIWFTPGMPMRAKAAQQCVDESREACERNDIDYMVSFVCGARFARGVHALMYNRDEEGEARAADACYREMSDVYRNRGIFVGRAPTEYQSYHQQFRTDAVKQTCDAIKSVLDPNGVIAPGRYGIG